jgi:hypothetical protein
MVLHWGYELCLSKISHVIMNSFVVSTCEALISMIMHHFFLDLMLLIHGSSYFHVLIADSKRKLHVLVYEVS